LHNEKLHDFCSPTNTISVTKSKRIKYAWHLTRAYRVLTDKSKESRQLTPNLEDNIKMDLKGTGFEDADCSRVAQDRDTWQALLNTVISLAESIKRGGNFLIIRGNVR
jgi:hypothetical protein